MPLTARPAPPKTRTGLPCMVGVLLDKLDKSDRTILTEWMNAPVAEWGHKAIVEELRKEGIDDVSGQAIGRHRRRDCACEQT